MTKGLVIYGGKHHHDNTNVAMLHHHTITGFVVVRLMLTKYERPINKGRVVDAIYTVRLTFDCNS